MNTNLNSNPRPSHPSDEIDLIDLIKTLWAARVLIIAVTVVVTLLAGVYAYAATPVYQVKTVLRAPQLTDLDYLNAATKELYSITPQEALQRVGNELESYNTRWSYFRDNIELFEGLYRDDVPLEQAFERMNEEVFRITLPAQNPGATANQVSLQLEYPEGVDGVAIVNGLTDYVVQLETEQVRNDFSMLLNNRISSIQKQIAAVNETIDLVQQPPSAEITQNSNTNGSRVAAFTRELEIVSAIKAREVAASFSQSMAKNRGDIRILENLRTEQNPVLRLVRLDQPAQEPLNPIKPRKMLILAAGIVFGGILGVMIALLRSALRNAKH